MPVPPRLPSLSLSLLLLLAACGTDPGKLAPDGGPRQAADAGRPEDAGHEDPPDAGFIALIEGSVDFSPRSAVVSWTLSGTTPRSAVAYISELDRAAACKAFVEGSLPEGSTAVMRVGFSPTAGNLTDGVFPLGSTGPYTAAFEFLSATEPVILPSQTGTETLTSFTAPTPTAGNHFHGGTVDGTFSGEFGPDGGTTSLSGRFHAEGCEDFTSP